MNQQTNDVCRLTPEQAAMLGYSEKLTEIEYEAMRNTPAHERPAALRRMRGEQSSRAENHAASGKRRFSDMREAGST